MRRMPTLLAIAALGVGYARAVIDEGEGDWIAPPPPKKKPEPITTAPEKEYPETRQQRRARERAELKRLPKL